MLDPFKPDRPVSRGVAGAVFGETGSLMLSDAPQTVTLNRTYDDPVAIAFVATENDSAPVNVRISEVDADRMTLQLQEPDYLDGVHALETVNYLVVEAGTWILSNGAVLEAGTLFNSELSSWGFDPVSFDAEFDDTPVVLSQVQSFVGKDFVTTRQRGADVEGFELTMQEEEARNDGGHLTEKIGWVAIEAGAGLSGDVSWVAGVADGITDAGASVDLGVDLVGGAKAIASLSSFEEADSAWARGGGSTSGTASLSVEEDASLDAETGHVGETIDFFAFDEAGFLSAAPIQDIGETGIISLSTAAQTVTLQRSYENPVVIALVSSLNERDPVNVRISGVVGDQLTLQLQEPNHLDGVHVAETVNFIVVEAGRWVLPNGAMLEADTLSSNKLSPQGFETVAFDVAFDETPVVLSHVQSFVGKDFVTTRQRGADADGFQLTMQEEEARNNGGHLTETLGWVAMEASDGVSGDVRWLSGSADGVDHLNPLVMFPERLPYGANVVGTLSSFEGRDTAWANVGSQFTGGFRVSAVEDTSRDPETDHADETFDYFVFDQAGLLAAHDYDLLA